MANIFSVSLINVFYIDILTIKICAWTPRRICNRVCVTRSLCISAIIMFLQSLFIVYILFILKNRNHSWVSFSGFSTAYNEVFKTVGQTDTGVWVEGG